MDFEIPFDEIKKRYAGALETWAIHVGGKYVETENSMEVHVPNNFIIHFDSEKTQFIPYESGLLEINIFIFDYTDPEQTMSEKSYHNSLDDMSEITLDTVQSIVQTCDDTVSSLEFGTHHSLTGMKGKNMKLEIEQNPEKIIENWKTVSENERVKQFKKMPDSHHKEILRNELQSAGLLSKV